MKLSRDHKAIILGALVTNIIACILFFYDDSNNFQNKMGRFFFALLLLNLLFGSLFFLEKFFKKLKLETRLSGDLALKHEEVRFCDKCPNCQKRTISPSHAIHTAQTCGECHMVFKVTKAKYYTLFYKILVFVSLFAFFSQPYLAPMLNLSKNVFLLLFVVPALGAIILIEVAGKKLERVNYPSPDK